MKVFMRLSGQYKLEKLNPRWDKIGNSFLGIGDIAVASAPPSWLVSIISTLSIGAGFMGGFLLGFKYG